MSVKGLHTLILICEHLKAAVGYIDTYISWLDSHSDKVEVLGSNPRVSTNKFNGLVQMSVELGEMPKITNSNSGATKRWSPPKVKLWNKMGFGDVEAVVNGRE